MKKYTNVDNQEGLQKFAVWIDTCKISASSLMHLNETYKKRLKEYMKVNPIDTLLEVLDASDNLSEVKVLPMNMKMLPDPLCDVSETRLLEQIKNRDKIVIDASTFASMAMCDERKKLNESQ